MFRKITFRGQVMTYFGTIGLIALGCTVFDHPLTGIDYLALFLGFVPCFCLNFIIMSCLSTVLRFKWLRQILPIPIIGTYIMTLPFGLHVSFLMGMYIPLSREYEWPFLWIAAPLLAMLMMYLYALHQVCKGFNALEKERAFPPSIQHESPKHDRPDSQETRSFTR
ncbi:MAG: hypothetical protein AAF558_09370 [Verrucomicrobiota bacterium]